MKNEISCKNCSGKNPYFNLTCNNCSAYLRDRVYNIDIWNLQWKLIESPVQAFKKIIFAEHKNLTIFSLFLISLKILINLFILFPWISGETISFQIFPKFFLYGTFGFYFFIILTSIITKLILGLFGNETKLKDIFSSLVFVNFPHIYSLIFLFPIEILIFGSYLFSTEPSPFLVNEFPAYIIVILEIIILLHTIFLSGAGTYAFTKSKISALIFAVIYTILLSAYFYLSTYI